jgi:hypothetical protein
MQLHYRGAFAGIGVGVLRYRESTGGMADWYAGTVSEIHAGYTFPKGDRLALEVLASVSIAEIEFGRIVGLRLVAGVRL